MRLHRSFQEATDKAFYDWMREVAGTPEEPWKIPRAFVREGEYIHEHIQAWFEQVSRQDLRKHLEIQIYIHSEDRLLWLWNTRSNGWISDDEVQWLWFVEKIEKDLKPVLIV